jgi:hypothetical protein
MLQTQVDAFMANMEDKAEVKADKPVPGMEEELISMALMFWT